MDITQQVTNAKELVATIRSFSCSETANLADEAAADLLDTLGEDDFETFGLRRWATKALLLAEELNPINAERHAAWVAELETFRN